MQHLVLRSPDLFVEVTAEKCEFSKYDPQQHKTQTISLKATPKEEKLPEPSLTDLVNAAASAGSEFRAGNSAGGGHPGKHDRKDSE